MYSEKDLFSGYVLYYPEYESEIRARAQLLTRIETLETGALRSEIVLTLKDWNYLKRTLRGMIFQRMKYIELQPKLF